MHHKFVVIDGSEPEDLDNPYPEYDDESASGNKKCAKCANSGNCGFSDQEGDIALSGCEICDGEKVSITSKEALLKWPSDSLPQLPKYGLLITGSLNWSMQVGNFSLLFYFILFVILLKCPLHFSKSNFFII